MGPLDAPQKVDPSEAQTPTGDDEGKKGGDKPEEKKEDEKSKRPPQIPPYNTPADYEAAALPIHVPHEFSPSTPLPFPHLLGFTNTFIRLGRFLNRRKMADNIGREVAAVCFATAREYRTTDLGKYEQQLALQWEEKDWVKSVWKEEKPKEDDASQLAGHLKERIWASPIVMDPRVAMRMRRFEMSPEDEARARKIVVPEEEIEGWIKGSLRSVVRWGADAWKGQERKTPYVGDDID